MNNTITKNNTNTVAEAVETKTIVLNQEQELVNVATENRPTEIEQVNNTDFDTNGKPIKPTKKKKNLVRIANVLETAANNVDYIGSFKLLQNPLKYEGGKYHDLPQILPYIPSDVDTFVDAFGGAFTMGINVKAKSLIYNEFNANVYNFIKVLSLGTPEENLQKVKDVIESYNLHGLGNVGFDKLKKSYNNSATKCPFEYYVLSIFPIMGFVKFDKDGNFTSNIGFTSSFNNDLQAKFLDYSKHLIENANIQYYNKSFEFVYDLGLTTKDFVYCDVPYFNSKAGYNLHWTDKMDTEVLDMLDWLNTQGIRFAYSNVIEHKSKVNQKLIDWAKENNYTIHNLDKSYKKKIQLDADGKEIEQITQEVLITNYTKGLDTNIEVAKALNENKFIIQGKALNDNELLRANKFIELADNELVECEKSTSNFAQLNTI